MNVLKQMDNSLARVEGWLIICCLWLMVVFTFIQVCLRGLYSHGHVQWANDMIGTLDWSEPFVRLLVLWLTFLGASLVTREDKHIRIDLLRAILPPKWLPVRELILSIACALICAVMVVVSINYIKVEIQFGSVMFAGLPAWTGELIIPAGFSSIFFRFLLRAIDQGAEIRRSRRP